MISPLKSIAQITISIVVKIISNIKKLLVTFLKYVTNNFRHI